MQGSQLRRSCAMAIFEQLLEFAAHESAREQSAEKAERERVFHSVFEDACGGTIRLKRVSMLPVGEGTGNLDVAEIAPLFVALVFGNPAPAKGPSSKPQHDTRSALDSSCSLDNFDVFPGRREPFERIRQGVPGVHCGCGSLNSGAVDEDFSLHESLLQNECRE